MADQETSWKQSLRERDATYVSHIDGVGGPISHSNVGANGHTGEIFRLCDTRQKRTSTYKPESKPPCFGEQGPANEDWVTVWFLGLKW